MFGTHQLLERKLRKTGKAALATVTACDRTHSMNESVAGGVGEPKTLCKLQLRVEPDGEPVFEASTNAWMMGTKGAYEGMVVPVLYDPSDHGKVVVDQSEEAWKPADRRNADARFAARAAARGDDPGRTAAMLNMKRAAATDPEGFRTLMREQGPAAFGLQGAATSFPIAAPTSEPTVDQLSKLADLHDRGALTDAEFEAEKKKLLGQ